MPDRQHLLSTKQMAEFVSQGYLRFDGMLSRDFCDRMLDEINSKHLTGVEYLGCHIDQAKQDTTLGEALALPQVRGVIDSLLGPDSSFDHFAVHTVPGNRILTPTLHQDAEFDVRPCAYDIQISIFPHDTPKEMGGTIFVPGSQFRRVHESQINRYQHVIGQQQTICEAGTVVFWHHNVWHGAASNHTDTPRYMVKTRLNPTHRQTLTWNTDDINDPEVRKILARNQPWQAQENRLELMNRTRLWRHLTDDPDFDMTFYWTRVTNEPQNRAETPAGEPVA